MSNQHTPSEVEALVAELHALAKAGLTRVEAKKVFKGRRGKSWVEVHFPRDVGKNLNQVYANQNIQPTVKFILKND